MNGWAIAGIAVGILALGGAVWWAVTPGLAARGSAVSTAPATGAAPVVQRGLNPEEAFRQGMTILDGFLGGGSGK